MAKSLRIQKPKQTIDELGRAYVGKIIDGSKVVSYSKAKNGFTVWLLLEDGRKVYRTRNSKP